MESLEIGLFQLENLILMRSPFLFFSLSHSHLQSTSGKLNSYLVQAVPVHADRILDHLKELGTAADYPLVLICEDGIQSQDSATALASAGFSNVYVVEGGLSGLLKEVDQSGL